MTKYSQEFRQALYENVIATGKTIAATALSFRFQNLQQRAYLVELLEKKMDITTASTWFAEEKRLSSITVSKPLLQIAQKMTRFRKFWRRSKFRPAMTIRSMSIRRKKVTGWNRQALHDRSVLINLYVTSIRSSNRWSTLMILSNTLSNWTHHIIPLLAII